MKKHIDKVRFERDYSICERNWKNKIKDYEIDSKEKRKDISKENFGQLFKNEEINYRKKLDNFEKKLKKRLKKRKMKKNLFWKII